MDDKNFGKLLNKYDNHRNNEFPIHVVVTDKIELALIITQ